ncbi:MAG: hypothetical protein ACXABY_11205 [Candidatus Thorarchaeota archaeon]|jgi:hypothetical protein
MTTAKKTTAKKTTPKAAPKKIDRRARNLAFISLMHTEVKVGKKKTILREVVLGLMDKKKSAQKMADALATA